LVAKRSLDEVRNELKRLEELKSKDAETEKGEHENLLNQVRSE